MGHLSTEGLSGFSEQSYHSTTGAQYMLPRHLVHSVLLRADNRLFFSRQLNLSNLSLRRTSRGSVNCEDGPFGAMIGVDEAGKGAVVGSMFVAAVACAPDALPDGVRDSKLLAPDERERIAAHLRSSDSVTVAVVEITPKEIDTYVADGGMNDLMVEAHGRALDALASQGRVIADASDVSAERFARRLSERADDSYDVSAEHGADEAHDVVGAASVVAKVERDAHVGRYDAGSGYPGDPATVEYLQERAPDFPACVRKSWSTAERIEREERQTGFNDF